MMRNDCEVLTEFAKLTDELTKTAAKKEPKEEKLEEETGEELIEKAHPEAVYLAEAMGNGGLVENQNEQHEAIMRVMNKMPTGNYVHIYAEVVKELVKIANLCDDAGDCDAADLITQVAQELVDSPF